jgi:hypothetical protein
MILLAWIYYYAILGFIVFLLAIPIALLLTNTRWYIRYKERKEAERWERISKFFAENADKYPDAAISFEMAKFWASPQGYDTMHKIKEAEYYS